MKVGIDKIGFYAPNTYIDLIDLAKARDVDPNKFLIGIGQERQTVVPLSQDVVSMAANAATSIISESDRDTIDMILFGTETGVDNSKSAAIYLQQLLGLRKDVRTVELKQACYGATAGVLLARDYVTVHPDRRVLVIGSDIARYGLKTAGEVTQGGGAVAMIISAEPRILALEAETSHISEDIMDFWRPINRREALVDGKYSTNVYLDFFQTVFESYKKRTNRELADFDAMTFHLPFTKMGLKGLRTVLDQVDANKQNQLMTEFENSRVYNKQIGNLYTGSLYLSLLSLLSETKLDPGSRVGLFSYGSGAEGEFYSGILQEAYKRQLYPEQMAHWLDNRTRLTISEYETIFNQSLPADNEDFETDINKDGGVFVFAGIKDKKRIYRKK